MGKSKAKKRTFKQFLKDKDIEISLKKYFVDENRDAYRLYLIFQGQKYFLHFHIFYQ